MCSVRSTPFRAVDRFRKLNVDTIKFVVDRLVTSLPDVFFLLAVSWPVLTAMLEESLGEGN